MLSTYLILIISGVASLGLSFLTWLILTVGFTDMAVPARLMAAVGLTYFLIHFIGLMLLRLNISRIISARLLGPKGGAASASPILPVELPALVATARTIVKLIGRLPAVRRLAWVVLAATAIALCLSKPASKT